MTRWKEIRTDALAMRDSMYRYWLAEALVGSRVSSGARG